MGLLLGMRPLSLTPALKVRLPGQGGQWVYSITSTVELIIFGEYSGPDFYRAAYPGKYRHNIDPVLHQSARLKQSQAGKRRPVELEPRDSGRRCVHNETRVDGYCC